MADNADEVPKNWKLQLRYGRLKTRFSHHTVLVDVEVIERTHLNQVDTGPAIMAFKAWAGDNDELSDMTAFFVEKFGCRQIGRAYFYDTAPEEPPREKPHGYDFNFTPYSEESDQ